MSVPAPSSAGPPPAAARRAANRHAPKRRQGAAFWLVAVTFAAAMAFSTVPSPLYALYQAQDHFSAFTVTIVFAVYAVGVVASLLLAGHVSDWVGRKRVLISAIALEVLAAVVFAVWPQVAGLLVARFVTGLGVGMLTATATAYLHDLHRLTRPGQGTGRFEIVSSAANIGGLGLGPLLAGALAQFAPEPLLTPYVLFAIALLLSVIAISVSPETVVPPPERPRYRPQRISVGQGAHTRYLAAAGAAFSAFAIYGLFTSLAAGFVEGTLGVSNHLVIGAVIFVMFAASALAQIASGWLPPGSRLAVGIVAEALGLVVLALGMEGASLVLFLIGAAIAGLGAGVLFKTAIGTVSRLATERTRGESLAGLFLIAYLGLIGPVVGLGVATQFLPELTALLWFTGALLAVLVAVAVVARIGSRRPRLVRVLESEGR
ncbi:MAG: MFS transporter [Candidatus Dormiibacterota bacterium]